MPRIFLIDERIDGAEGGMVQRLMDETSDADVVAHLSAATSLVKVLPQVRRAWLNRYQHPSAALCIAASGSLGRLQLGREGLSSATVNLLVPLRGFAGGRVVLWGIDAGAWALHFAPPIPALVAAADSPEGEPERRSEPVNPGRTFLHAIAQSLGLPVFANVHPQRTRATWRFTGRHVILQPNGAHAISDALE